MYVCMYVASRGGSGSMGARDPTPAMATRRP